MKDHDRPDLEYSPEDVEFLLREHGLSTSANLVSALKDLENELKTGTMDVSEAFTQCIQFTRRTGATIATQFAILESRIRAIETQLDGA